MPDHEPLRSALRVARHATVATPVGVGIALALALAGCGGPEPSRAPVEVWSARLTAPGTVELVVQSCNGDPEVTRLVETDVDVSVEVTATVPLREGPACQDLLEVVLAEPLGDRVLLDLRHAVPDPVDVDPVPADAAT